MKKLREILGFLTGIWQSRHVLATLVKNDLRQRYLSSFLGILWAFVHPLVTIVVFWFIFQVGFKSKPVENYPFILWLVTGLIPWFYFSDAVAAGTQAVVANTHLVKKIVFRVGILPLVKILSALTIHLFFVGLLFVLFLLYGYTPDLHWLQIVYYIFAATLFVTGIAWLTSSLVVFLKDVGELVTIFLQIAFWMTPIFWDIHIVPEKYRLFLKLNPIYYLIQGYRDSLIHHIWFWERPLYTLYFWAVCLFTLYIGAFTFKRLRPHFADVL